MLTYLILERGEGLVVFCNLTAGLQVLTLLRNRLWANNKLFETPFPYQFNGHIVRALQVLAVIFGYKYNAID